MTLDRGQMIDGHGYRHIDINWTPAKLGIWWWAPALHSGTNNVVTVVNHKPIKWGNRDLFWGWARLLGLLHLTARPQPSSTNTHQMN